MRFIKTFAAVVTATISLTSQAASVWKVSSSTHSLYIGGTIHILTPDDYPLPKEYDNAYQKADKLIFETDMAAINSPEFGQKMLGQMTYTDGTTLDKTLTTNTYTALSEHLASRNVPVQAFANYKPNLVAITLTVMELQAMGYTSIGVDQFYSNLAVEQNKPQAWLETPEQQLSFIANMGKDDPNAMIEYTLKDMQNMPQMLGTLHSTWLNGDMPGMAAVGITPFKTDYPAIYQDLLVTRNNNWLPQIIAMLEDKPTEFILVGALHLSGPDSVLTKLKAKGYTIEKL